jgi:general stress protein CsbA
MKNEKGGMMTEQKKKKKPYLPMIIFGIISLTSYVVLFMNEQLVTDTYTKGGYYAAFPIVTAFWFSFIHGAFASNLLTVFGIEAKKK